MLQKVQQLQKVFQNLPKYSAATAVKQSEGVKQEQKKGENSQFSFENIFLHFSQKQEQIQNNFSEYSIENDIQPAIKQFQQIGFNKTFFTQLYKQSPFSLIKLSQQNQQNTPIKSDIFQVTELLKSLKIDDQNIKFVILKFPQIFEIGTEEFKNRIKYLQEQFQYSEEQVRHIVTYYPQLLDNEYFVNIPEKLHFLKSWIKMTSEQISTVLIKYPWFLNIETQSFKTNIRTLTSRGFTSENIIQIIENDPECLAMKPENFQKSFYIPTQVLNIPNSVYVKHMTNNPQLISICPTSIMPIKHKIMIEDYLIPQETVSYIYINYPEVFIKSIASLKIKLKYLTQRYKMDLLKDSAFPKILAYNYQDKIRPRGEAMLKTQVFYPFEEILDITDEEFCKKLDIKLENFNKIKNTIEASEETDIKKRYFHKYFGSNYKRYLQNFETKNQQ